MLIRVIKQLWMIMFIFQYRLCHEWLNSWCKNTYWQSKSGNTGQWTFSSKSVLGLIHKYCVLTSNAIHLHILVFLQNHWFTYNETMTVESITQAVSNLALQFGEEDADPGAMVWPPGLTFYCIIFPFSAGQLSLVVDIWLQISTCSIFRAVLLVSLCFLEVLMRKDLSCKYTFYVFRTVCSI